MKVSAQQNVGIGTTTPNASARLDITATNRGLLIPRVALTGLTDAVTVPTPATSLLVFNTNAAVTGGTGFYFNNGTSAAPSWVKLGTGGGGSGWALTGNAGTDSTANFLGTTDAKPLVFRVNNGFAGQIGSRGGISLGRAANGTSRITPPGVIAIGDSALFRNRDSASIAIGNHAMFNNNDIFPSENIAIGDFSLFTNTIGFRNVAVGRFALSFVDTAANNTAVGYRALMFNEAEDNTAVGSLSQLFDSTGTGNTSLGVSSLRENVVGDFNTAIGAFTSVFNGGQFGNTATGAFALALTDGGSLNAAVGFQALVSNVDGEENTAVGANALLNNTSGFSNVAVGGEALSTNTLGSLNIAVGTSALLSVEGNENTAVGDNALAALGIGDFNTALGSGAGGTGDFDNTIAIGAGATVTASNTVVIGNSAITSIKGQVNFSTFSDGRYKTDVEENVKGLDFIMQLRPVTYHYNFGKIRGEQQHTGTNGARTISANYFSGLKTPKGDREMSLQKTSFKPSFNGNAKGIRLKGRSGNATLDQYYSEVSENDQIRYTGFIAQEVEAAAKKSGFEFSGVDKPQNDKDHYALRYAEFVVPLVKAVQEQQAVIESQNKKIEDLTRRLQALEQK